MGCKDSANLTLSSFLLAPPLSIVRITTQDSVWTLITLKDSNFPMLQSGKWSTSSICLRLCYTYSHIYLLQFSLEKILSPFKETQEIFKALATSLSNLSLYSIVLFSTLTMAEKMSFYIIHVFPF